LPFERTVVKSFLNKVKKAKMAKKIKKSKKSKKLKKSKKVDIGNYANWIMML
jgi:hypothetical protein